MAARSMLCVMLMFTVSAFAEDLTCAGGSCQAKAVEDDTLALLQSKSRSKVTGCGPDVRRIFIWRHAERPSDDADSCLNECGWERAEYWRNWAEFYRHEGNIDEKNFPAKVFAFNYKLSPWPGCQRCAQTASLVAAKYFHKVHYLSCQNDTVNCAGKQGYDYGLCQAEQQDILAGDALRNMIENPNGPRTILVVWEHDNIHSLVHRLANYILPFKWDSTDFNHVIDLHYSLQQDGKYHHCAVYDASPKPPFDASANHTKGCPACKNDASRRRGCPPPGSTAGDKPGIIAYCPGASQPSDGTR